MRRHLDTLGWAFSFYGALLVALMSVASAVAAVSLALSHTPWLLTVAAVGGLAVLGLLLAVPFLLTGRGLRARKPWARPAALVLSVLALGDVPIGMALGVFGLATLLGAEARREFAA